MGVKFKMNSPNQLLELVSVAPAIKEAADNLFNTGYKLELGFNTVSLVDPYGVGVGVVTLPVPNAALLEKPYALTAGQKLVIGKSMVKLVNMGTQHATGVAAGDKASIITSGPAVSLEVPVTKVPVTPAAMAGMKPLKEATALLQPVTGTSAGSIYRVIAIAKGGVKLAARLQATTLSVRAEGDFTEMTQAALKECGFATSNGYMSAHYDVAAVPVSRVLGAILFDDRLGLSEVVGAADFTKAAA